MPGNFSIFHKYSIKTLQSKIDSYFEKAKKKKTPLSLTGLALHLGCTRLNITDYSKTDEYGSALSEAKLRCENSLEEKMISGSPPTGLIFILKNNYGWKDRTEVDATIKGTLSLSALFAGAAKKKKEEEAAIEGEIVNEEPIKIEAAEELPEELF